MLDTQTDPTRDRHRRLAIDASVATVTMVVDPTGGLGLETVVAFVVPASGAAPDPEVLEAHCRDGLASFKRPRRVIVTEQLPKTATGTIKLYELRESLQGRRAVSVRIVIPQRSAARDA